VLLEHRRDQDHRAVAFEVHEPADRPPPASRQRSARPKTPPAFQ
jgi:hypothetical protein